MEIDKIIDLKGFTASFLKEAKKLFRNHVGYALVKVKRGCPVDYHKELSGEYFDYKISIGSYCPFHKLILTEDLFNFYKTNPITDITTFVSVYIKYFIDLEYFFNYDYYETQMDESLLVRIKDQKDDKILAGIYYAYEGYPEDVLEITMELRSFIKSVDKTKDIRLELIRYIESKDRDVDDPLYFTPMYICSLFPFKTYEINDIKKGDVSISEDHMRKFEDWPYMVVDINVDTKTI